MKFLLYATVVILLTPCINASLVVDSSCARAIYDYEIKYGIPKGLLHAIALAESGRKAENDILTPWPWTINAAGKPYVMETKAAAVKKAKQLRGSGINSMDLGPLQVNLLHHPNAFANLDEAFDIKKNVEYAAKLLKANFKKSRSWFKAIADYHSKTPSRGQKYKRKVIKIWQMLLAKNSGDKASPDSVMHPSNTTIKSDSNSIDIKMVPLSGRSSSPQPIPERRFFPINSSKFRIYNGTSTKYNLTQGRKFFKLH